MEFRSEREAVSDCLLGDKLLAGLSRCLRPVGSGWNYGQALDLVVGYDGLSGRLALSRIWERRPLLYTATAVRSTGQTGQAVVLFLVVGSAWK